MKQQLSKTELTKVRWHDLTSEQKTAVVVAASIELTMAVTAWVNLARRPSDQVRGPKALWAGIIAINGVGPIAYFIAGRRRRPQ